MARITEGFVIQFGNATFESLAHRCCAPRCIKSFVLNPINGETFYPIEWSCDDSSSLGQGFPEMTILVDQPGRAPAQVIFHLVAGRQRQCADSHFDRANRLKRVSYSTGNDIDCARSQTTLRHESGPAVLAQTLNVVTGFDVFSQIEIGGFLPGTDFCDRFVKVVGSSTYHRVTIGDERFDLRRLR